MTIAAGSSGRWRLLPVMLMAVRMTTAWAGDSGALRFQSAQPVWASGRDGEKNLTLRFRAVVEMEPGREVTLRVASSTLYRAFVNGSFCGHGPARAGHGYYRVDEWDVTRLLKPGDNVVALEVAGYNVNSYYLLDQPSFLQAEMISMGRVLAATGVDTSPTFVASPLAERVQRVQRTSFQRPFCEVYRLTEGWDRWRTDPNVLFTTLTLSVAGPKRLLPRGVPLPRFACLQPQRQVWTGKALGPRERDSYWSDRSLVNVGPSLGGYRREELEVELSKELQRIETSQTKRLDLAWDQTKGLSLEDNSCTVLDFGRDLTGFAGVSVRCTSSTRLFLVFSELLRNDDVDGLWGGWVNAVLLELQPGNYRFETLEPYTFRYMKLIAMGGGCDVSRLYLREYANDDCWEASFACSDERLNRIFEAARETFRQNSPDIFMDCPSRERAGWLCDSFFTARTARDLCSSPSVERNFLENFMLPARFEHLPDGMLPMCYPSDHCDGVFIPNWALWFVLELEEYLGRSGDRALVNSLRPRVLSLFDYLRKFRNSDGLLESLESWIFVEWSDANHFVRDVSYPTNMLYAGALSAAGHVYGRPEMQAEADAVRNTIRLQSFDGEFFVDNALRRDGRLDVTRNRSEACQYYAFYFGVATQETHPELWKRLVGQFGPGRDSARVFPEVRPSNMFIGNMLRMDLLGREGETGKLSEEMPGYCLHMAQQTGTLWEHGQAAASCNHGFASHVAHLMFRDLLGIRMIDPVGRRVVLRAPSTGLDWCEGRVHVPGGFVSLCWSRRPDGKLEVTQSVPAGYHCVVEAADGVELMAGR